MEKFICTRGIPSGCGGRPMMSNCPSSSFSDATSESPCRISTHRFSWLLRTVVNVACPAPTPDPAAIILWNLSALLTTPPSAVTIASPKLCRGSGRRHPTGATIGGRAKVTGAAIAGAASTGGHCVTGRFLWTGWGTSVFWLCVAGVGAEDTINGVGGARKGAGAAGVTGGRYMGNSGAGGQATSKGWYATAGATGCPGK
mmetsp:Transcript_34217/g.54843  ORF Transcript_34217/g.54843 Transcript_34217/m.54843 type:complete len:200 (+) Transcript_34217:429-1028(+)